MAERHSSEALEKLNRGIQESKEMVQKRAMQLAQEFFGDSVEELKQRIKESRRTLEKLPGQIPGGDEEAFQMLFQELMDSYSTIEEALDEAGRNVADLDTDSLVRQGEVDATDAARREAREAGLDLTEIEGTGTDGRITVEDVKKAAETVQQESEEAAEAPRASDAARRKAEELGIDLSRVEGTGSGGLITVKDVTSLAGDAQEQAAGEASEETRDAAGESADDGSGEPKATNAARRKAEELGVDLSRVQGSGAGGLITIKDIVE
ncbi:MAG: E3 binding domain-containing protein [Actinomycetota bacterium]